MADKVIIFGKDTWPYTQAAREDYANRDFAVEYHDVRGNQAALDAMLGHSNGRREVPVIVEGSEVKIGFGGSWGV